MSNRAASQGGALLRTSRMFSLPAKLPSPPGTNSTMASQVFKSNTATDVFPTYQTVTTYPSSRLRGDWGFKRPLPLRSTTRSKTPLIRVKHIDSIEHVTDFNSASDHTLTVEKFHQLGVPLTIPPQKTQDKFLSTAKDLTEGTSVFEEDFDAADGNTSTNKRWKFSGPWLAGIPEGHFQKYLTKKVRYRRNEFKNYLREVLAKEMNVANRNAALEQGIAPQFEDAELIATDITEEQLTEYIRVLRNDRPRLFEHVGKFLDLAPLDTELAQMSFLPKATGESTSLVFNHNPYAQNGPPITHPSAGMSYIRTSAYMTNHPVYGPQKQHPAIRANVLQPKSPAFGRFAPTVGVAGIVASVATTDSNFQSTSRNNISGLNSFDSESDRAPEVNVQPLWARIGSDGRVILKVKQADTENVAVQKELRGEEKIFGTPLRDANALLAQGGSLEPMPKRLQTQARTIMGNSRVYGFM